MIPRIDYSRSRGLAKSVEVIKTMVHFQQRHQVQCRTCSWRCKDFHYVVTLSDAFGPNINAFVIYWLPRNMELELLTPNPSSENTYEPTLLATHPLAPPARTTLLQTRAPTPITQNWKNSGESTW